MSSAIAVISPAALSAMLCTVEELLDGSMLGKGTSTMSPNCLAAASCSSLQKPDGWFDRLTSIGASLDKKIVNDMQRIPGTGHRGIYPLVGFLRRIEGEVSGNVYIDVFPFATLRLVAGDGIAEHTA